MNARPVLLDVVLAAVSAIVEHKLRAFLTTLGIVFGTMAVIAVVAIVQGTFRLYTSELEGLGAGFLFVVGESSNNATHRQRVLGKDESEYLLSHVESVVAASPYYLDHRRLSVGADTQDAAVLPVNASYPDIQNHFVEEGRFFTDAEEHARSRVVVLGRALAQSLGLSQPVGEQVRLYGVPFLVVGVLEDKEGTNAFGQRFDQSAVVPHQTARGFSGPMRGGTLLVKLDNAADVDVKTDAIRRALRQAHTLRPGEPDDFRIVTQGDVLKRVAGIADMATWVVVAIVSVALLVGGIGIMNIMLVSVTERTREIGLRRALGARAVDVLVQFLAEATLLGMLGGVIGVLLGIGAAHAVYAVVPGFPAPHVPLWSVVLACGFSAAVGLVFGFYPALRASRLDPIEALRFE